MAATGGGAPGGATGGATGGGAAAPGGLGVSAASTGMGFGVTSGVTGQGSPGSPGMGASGTSTGMGFVVPRGLVSQGPVAQANANAVMSSTLNVPVTTQDGSIVTHQNLSNVNAPVDASARQTARFFNNLSNIIPDSPVNTVDGPVVSTVLSALTPTPLSVLGLLGNFAVEGLTAARSPANIASVRGFLSANPPGGRSGLGGVPRNIATGGQIPSRSVVTEGQVIPRNTAITGQSLPIPTTEPTVVSGDPVSGDLPTSSLINVILEDALARINNQRSQTAIPTIASNRDLPENIRAIRNEFLSNRPVNRFPR